MAIRNTTHVLKKSLIPSQTLPSSGILQGEPLVNLGDGILFFTGGTAGSPTWVDSGNATSGYFEVGSNLYQLKIRDKIISYSGVTNLTGKFLSGTTSGFVLADISDIAASVDSYTTGATWDPNVLTIKLNNGKPSVPVTIDSFTALTINGDLYVTGTETVNNLTITGTGLYNTTATGSNPLEIVNYSSLTAFSQTNDVYVTGSTLTSATNNTNNQSSLLLYHGTPIGGPYTIDTENTFTTGGTYNSGTTSLDFSRNDGVSYSVSLSGIDINDTFSTGGTVTQSASNNNNQQVIQITGNNGFTPYNITGLTDTFATGFTFSSNTLTIQQNNGVDLNTSIDTIDLSGVLSAVTFDINTTGNITANSFSGSSFSGGTFYGDGSNLTGINNYFVTGGTVSYDSSNLNATLTLTRNDNVNVTITGLTDVRTTGATLVGENVYFDTNQTLSAYTLNLSALDINDTYVTAYTYTASANTLTIFQNEGESPLSVVISEMSGLTINGNLNVTGNTNLGPTTATTIDATTIYSGGTDLITIIDGRDTYTTGFTYNPSTNTFSIQRNQNEPDLTASFNTVSGLTVSNLTSGRVVYVGSGGLLTDEAAFTYNDGTDTLGVTNIEASGDVTIQGSLTVFGPSISAFTSQLYVEDPNVIFNYNPTGSTTLTSVNAGLTIQDGNGITGGSVNFDIVRMQNLTGLTSTQVPSVSEYTSLTGYSNRGWITQLNDIVIRSTDVSDGGSAGDFNGVRVLAEFDVLDGGSY